MPNTTAPATGWRFDRTISSSTILSVVLALAALAAQSAVALTWSNTTTARIEELERANGRLLGQVTESDKRILDRGDERFRGITVRLDGLERDRAGDRERLVKVEEQFRWVAEALGRIERKLDVPLPRR